MNTPKTILLHNISPDEFKKELIEELKIEIQNLLEQTKVEKTVEFLTRKEVAEIFKVSIVTLSQWDKVGIIKPYRIGNLIRYKSDEIEEVLIKKYPSQL